MYRTSSEKPYNLFQGPGRLRQPGGHSRGNPVVPLRPEAQVRAAEVVVHEEQGNRGRVLLQLLAEGVRQASEAANAHPHGEVRPLHVASRKVLRIGATLNVLGAGACALGGAVPRLWAVRSGAVMLDELREVHALSERILDRRQVHPVAVSGELNSAGDAVGNVLHELGGGATVKRSNQPRQAELAISVKRGERPNVADAEFAILFFGDVLRLGVDEAPDFVALNPIGRHVANGLTLERGAGGAEVQEDLVDRVARNARHAGGSA